MNLYELSEWQRDLLARLEAVNDEGVPAPLPTEEEVNALCEQFAAKVEGVVRVMKNLEGELVAVSREKERLENRQSALAGRVKWLKSYLLASLTNAGETSIKAGIFKVRIQRNGQPSTYVDVSADKLPAKYQIPIIEPNKILLLEDFKAGAELPTGVTIVYGSHVRVN